MNAKRIHSAPYYVSQKALKFKKNWHQESFPVKIRRARSARMGIINSAYSDEKCFTSLLRWLPSRTSDRYYGCNIVTIRSAKTQYFLYQMQASGTRKAKPKTKMNTKRTLPFHNGLYSIARMSPGLRNGPGMFQPQRDAALSARKRQYILIYIRAFVVDRTLHSSSSIIWFR